METVKWNWRARWRELCRSVYQIESYRHRQEQLNRSDFYIDAQFGENSTITGSPDDAVCIGDRFQIGRIFEVAQPASPVIASGIAMNEFLPARALLTG